MISLKNLKIKHLKVVGLQRSEAYLNFLQESGMYCKNATDIKPSNMDCIVIKTSQIASVPLLLCNFSFLLCSFHSLLSLPGFSPQLRACVHHHLYRILVSGPNQPDFLFLTVPLSSRERKCDWLSSDKVIIPLFWGCDDMVPKAVSSRVW